MTSVRSAGEGAKAVRRISGRRTDARPSGASDQALREGPWPRTKKRGHVAKPMGVDRPARSPRPHGSANGAPEEPVWLVRAVLYLFLVGFAAFVAVELTQVLRSF